MRDPRDVIAQAILTCVPQFVVTDNVVKVPVEPIANHLVAVLHAAGYRIIALPEVKPCDDLAGITAMVPSERGGYVLVDEDGWIIDGENGYQPDEARALGLALLAAAEAAELREDQ